MEQWSTEQAIEEIETTAVWRFLQAVQDSEPLWALGVTDKDRQVFHKVREIIEKYNTDVGREQAAEHFMMSLGMNDEEYEAYCKGHPLP